MASPAECAAVCDILQACAEPVIFDLGSYDAGDAEWMARACSSPPHTVMVEADWRNFAAVRERSGLKWSGGGTTSIYHCAIGAVTGSATLYMCDNDAGQAVASSSIHKPTGHLKHFDWCRFDQRATVRTVSLDDIYAAEGRDHIDMLWVDIQGAEADMIRGGANALKHTRHLFIEAEEVEMYEGQVLRPQLLEMLGPDWGILESFDYNLLLRNGSAAFA